MKPDDVKVEIIPKENEIERRISDKENDYDDDYDDDYEEEYDENHGTERAKNVSNPF